MKKLSKIAQVTFFAAAFAVLFSISNLPQEFLAFFIISGLHKIPVKIKNTIMTSRTIFRWNKRILMILIKIFPITIP